MQLRSLGCVLLAGGCAAPAAAPVRPGIDVLLSDSAHLVRDRRVGILTHQSGVDAAGTPDIERLLAAGVRLTAIFSPEHGFRGLLDRENIEHDVDSATGLPVYSLYGEVREPTAEMLERIDVLLVDLQDIGGRPYTYVSSALRALRAAAVRAVPVVVLDRPNPIGGDVMQGPVLDPAFASWVGMLPVPLRHGMTLGELVRFGNAVLGIDGDLTVVPVAGWRRSARFDATELPWIRPSPNMPDLESATHYPGIVLFEWTNVSVGRGTPIAFQVVAAPWMDGPGVAAAVRGTPGVTVRDTVIAPAAPTDRKYAGREIPGVRFSVADHRSYDPVAFAVALLAALQGLHPDSLWIRPDGFDARAGTDRVRRAIEAGTDAETIVASWRTALDRFREARRPYLIY